MPCPLPDAEEIMISRTSDPDDAVVLINVFAVAPAEQDRLVSLLIKATEGAVDRAPLPFLQEALTFATFDPGMYRVERIFLPATT